MHHVVEEVDSQVVEEIEEDPEVVSLQEVVIEEDVEEVEVDSSVEVEDLTEVERCSRFFVLVFCLFIVKSQKLPSDYNSRS